MFLGKTLSAAYNVTYSVAPWQLETSLEGTENGLFKLIFDLYPAMGREPTFNPFSVPCPALKQNVLLLVRTLLLSFSSSLANRKRAESVKKISRPSETAVCFASNCSISRTFSGRTRGEREGQYV
jgi:hypothetical protein